MFQVETSIKAMGKEFMWNEHLGFVLTCPSNLGTGLRGGVHIKIPLLSQQPEFETILKDLRLQKRGKLNRGQENSVLKGLFLEQFLLPTDCKFLVFLAHKLHVAMSYTEIFCLLHSSGTNN